MAPKVRMEPGFLKPQGGNANCSPTLPPLASTSLFMDAPWDMSADENIWVSLSKVLFWIIFGNSTSHSLIKMNWFLKIINICRSTSLNMISRCTVSCVVFRLCTHLLSIFSFSLRQPRVVKGEYTAIRQITFISLLASNFEISRRSRVLGAQWR